jgi:glucans biosynthesis protein C
VFDAYALLMYVPFFGFGLLLAARPELLARYTRVPAVPGIALVAACAAFTHLGGGAAAIEVRAAAFLASLYAAWVAAALCFQAFRRFFGRPSALTTYLAEASYTVYLVHHLLVVAFAMAAIRVGLGGLPGMLVLIAAVTAASLFIHHHVVARSRYLRFLLNGVRPGPSRGVQVRFRRTAA